MNGPIRSPRWLSMVAVALVVALPLLAVGCASTSGPAFLTINAEEYETAFDTAADVARSYGLIPGLRDRRGGVIETEPAKAGSMIEPWDRLNVTPARAMENTFSHQRRSARFEFLPVAFDPDRTRRDEPLTGPDIFAEQREPIDLSAYDGELELRVWVYIERSDQPGLQRMTWTRRKSSRAHVIDPETGNRVRGSWTVVRRDPEAERILLARVQRKLSALDQSP